MPCISGRSEQQIRYQRYLAEYIIAETPRTDVVYTALMYSVGFSREESRRELAKAIDLRTRYRNGEHMEFGDL